MVRQERAEHDIVLFGKPGGNLLNELKEKVSILFFF